MNERGVTRWLLTGGIIGPVVFVAGFFVIGALRADYDPMRQFVSLLSLTQDGWQQVANFLVSGLLIIAGAVGLRRVMTQGPGSRWGPILIGLAGVGIVLAGVFATDPAQGYPPGTAAGLPASTSWHAAIHQLVSSFVFLGLPVATFVMARRFRAEQSRWAAYCWLSGVGIVVSLAAAFSLADVAGLLQRVAIVLAYGWVAQLAWRFRAELGSG
jgi:hypothetical membrane protein